MSGFIPEAAQQNENQIQNPADAKETHGEQPDDASTDLADVEPVRAKVTQEQAQEEGYPFIFRDVASEIFVDVCVVIHNIDDRLLGCSCAGLGCAALRAELGAICDLLATVIAIHKNTSFFLRTRLGHDSDFIIGTQHPQVKKKE